MIKIQNLSKMYNSKNKNQVLALSNINLSFSNNGLIFILGPSGCGKSTLLNILGGIDIPTEGSVLIEDNEIGTSEIELDNHRNKYVGFVFQGYNLIETMTVYDNLSLVCFEMTKDERDQKISECLKLVELSNYENRYPNELSGGQMQRIAIARALLKDSKFLLADEPTGNLNQEMGIEVLNLLKKISKEKLIIVVSHNEELAKLYADRIIRLRDGKVIEDDIINNIVSNVVQPEPKPKTLSKKIKAKFVLQNIIGSKLDFIVSFMTLFLCFISVAITFSIVNYNRVDVDIKNLKSNDQIDYFSLRRYTYNDTLGYFLSYSQVKQILDQYGELAYIKDGEIESSNDLKKFGLKLHDNYNEISSDGIYVFEHMIEFAIHREELFYDQEGKIPVEKQEEIDYTKLVNTYLKIHSYFDYYIRVDGIIQNITHPNYSTPFDNNDDTIKHQFFHLFQEVIPIFYLKNSSYSQVKPSWITEVHSDFEKGPKCIFVNNNEIEKFTFNCRYFYDGGLIITNDRIINTSNPYATNLDNVFKVENDNEIYISLELYNLIFNEYSDVNYYVKETQFNEYEAKNYPTHIGEKISIDILDYFFKDIKLEYDELIIKGVILKANEYYEGTLLVSKNIYNQIYEFNSTPHIYIQKDSIENINDFVKTCSEVVARPDYFGSSDIDAFEEHVRELKFIFFILSFILIIVSFLMMYNFINRIIKRKSKEIGILKAIGISNKDILEIYQMLVLVVNVVLLIVIIPLSAITIYYINTIVVKDVYSQLVIMYYKWWFALVTILLVFGVNGISSFMILKRFKKMKAIQVIKNT